MGLFSRKTDSEKTSQLPQSTVWSALHLFRSKENNLSQSAYNSHKQEQKPEAIACDSSGRLVPTSMPMCRLQNKHNSMVRAEPEKKESTLPQLWQHQIPRFHVGPRGRTDEETEQISNTSLGGDQQDAKIKRGDSKYVFVSQDGNIVEREVSCWPFRERDNPLTRYRLAEPHASRHGKRYRQRLYYAEAPSESNAKRRVKTGPIYLLPRRIVEENKHRLLTRYNFNDNSINDKPSCGPQDVDIGEKEQSSLIVCLQKEKLQAEAQEFLKYMSKQQEMK